MGKLVHADVKRMLRTPWPEANKVLEEVEEEVDKEVEEEEVEEEDGPNSSMYAAYERHTESLDDQKG